MWWNQGVCVGKHTFGIPSCSRSVFRSTCVKYRHNCVMDFFFLAYFWVVWMFFLQSRNNFEFPGFLRFLLLKEVPAFLWEFFGWANGLISFSPTLSPFQQVFFFLLLILLLLWKEAKCGVSCRETYSLVLWHLMCNIWYVIHYICLFCN